MRMEHDLICNKPIGTGRARINEKHVKVKIVGINRIRVDCCINDVMSLETAAFHLGIADLTRSDVTNEP